MAGPNDLIDFLKKSWLEGDYKMLFNTQSQVDHQRRAFSHSKKRMDLFDANKPVDSKHAKELMSQLGEYTQKDGPFSLPMTVEKIGLIEEIFQNAAKDITEHPKWDTLWSKDWPDGYTKEDGEKVKGFVQMLQESIDEEKPLTYLTPKQYTDYQTSPHPKAYLEQVASDYRKEIKNRVIGGYCFKMLTELLVKKKINKELCVVLQTIANHATLQNDVNLKENYSPTQMMAYLNNNTEKEFRNEINMTIENIYIDLGAHEDPDIEIDPQKVDEIIKAKMMELKKSKHYAKLPASRGNSMLEQAFKGEAKNIILDYIETRSHYLRSINTVKDTITEPRHQKKLETFRKLCVKSEACRINVAFEAEDLKDFEKLTGIVTEMELDLVNDHINLNIETWVMGEAHHLKERKDMDAFFNRILANDTVNGDHKATQMLLDKKLSDLHANMDELISLRLSMEESYNNPIDHIKARKAYHDKLNQMLKAPNLDEAKQLANIREKWMNRFEESQGEMTKSFKDRAFAIAMRNGSPMDYEKVSDIYHELEKVSRDLSSNEAFKADLESLPEHLRKETAQLLTENYRKKIISETEFVPNDGTYDPEDAKMRDNMAKSYFNMVNSIYHDKNDIECYEHLKHQFENQLTTQIEKTRVSIIDKVKSGKTLSEAVDLMKAEITRTHNTVAFNYLGKDAAYVQMIPLYEMKSNYTNLKLVIDGQLDFMADNFVPDSARHSGMRVLDLIDKSVLKIKESEAFKAMPEEGPIAIKRYLESPQALDLIYKRAVNERSIYFSKHLPDNLDTLINSKEDGLKWIRHQRARREVTKSLTAMITQGDKFNKRGPIATFFGVSLTKQQQNATKALQQEYIECIKADLATMTKEEGLDLLSNLKDDPMLKAIPRSSVGDLFKKKDRSAKNELEQLATVVENLPDKRSLKDVSLFSAYTSPEEDIALGLANRLSRALEDTSMLPSMQESTNKATHDALFTKMLVNPDRHQELETELKSIADPQERMNKIDELFAIAHKNDLFQYHNQIHIIHKKYSPEQKQGISLLQELYLEALKQEVHKKSWELAKKDHPDFSYDSQKISIGNWPAELSAQDKNDIYFEILAPSKKEPIMNCNITSEGVDTLKSKISDIVETVNGILDTGTSHEVKEAIQREKVQRMR